MIADKALYLRILDNRPLKLSPEEAEYRKASAGEKEGGALCANCWHFFTRDADDFHVCEVVRPPEEDEESIDPEYRCRFFTGDNGKTFPLLKS